MKISKANLKNLMIQLVKDESGQGIAEYVLLLVVVIGIAMLFRTQITKVVTDKISSVGDQIGTFSNGQ